MKWEADLKQPPGDLYFGGDNKDTQFQFVTVSAVSGELWTPRRDAGSVREREPEMSSGNNQRKILETMLGEQE